MFDFLIRALGGAPKHDWDLLNVTCESWRARAIAAETTVELFKEIMSRDKASARENAALQNAIEREVAQEQAFPPDLKPLGDRRVSSWPRIKRELERQHMVKQNAEVSREEIERAIRGEQQRPV